jgi:hypothetical protein
MAWGLGVRVKGFLVGLELIIKGTGFRVLGLGLGGFGFRV